MLTICAQGEVAARNILKLIKRAEREAIASAEQPQESEKPELPAFEEPEQPSEQAPAAAEKAEEEDLELQKYVPGAPAIKVSLGLVSPLPIVSVSEMLNRLGRADEERVPVPGHDRHARQGARGPRRAPHLALLRAQRHERGPRARPGGAACRRRCRGKAGTRER